MSDRIPEKRTSLGGRLAVLLGALFLLLLLALSVRATYSRGPSGATGGGEVAVGSVVQLLLLVGAGAIELIVLLLLVFAPWGRLRDLGRSGVPVPQLSRRMRWRLVLLPLGLLALQLVVLALLLQRRRHPFHGIRPPVPHHLTTSSHLVGSVGTVSLGETLGLAALLGVVVLLLLWAWGRLRRRSSQFQSGPTLPQDLAQDLDLSLEELASGGDPRQAVIAAYGRMRRTLARVGVAERASETPLEYLERALLQLRASRAALVRLTELFEIARFSHHPVLGSMRQEAESALRGLRAELVG